MMWAHNLYRIVVALLLLSTVGCIAEPNEETVDLAASGLVSTIPQIPMPALTQQARQIPSDCRPHVEMNQCGRWRGVELFAADRAGPDGHVVSERCLCEPIDVRIPEEIVSNEPETGQGNAKLRFDSGECTYKGTGKKGAPGHAFRLQACSGGLLAGAQVRSRYFNFEIHAGSQNLSALVKLGERRFVVDDPLLGNAALRVPMGAAPATQEFELTLEPMVPPGIFVSNGNGGVVSAGRSMNVTALGTSGDYSFAQGTCAELDLPLALVESGLAERPAADAAGIQPVRLSFSERSPDAVATLTPVEGGILELDLEAEVATVCVTHLSTFVLTYDDSNQVLVNGNMTFEDQNGLRTTPVRGAPLEVWRFRPRFLGIWGWGTGPDAVGQTDELGNYAVPLSYTQRSLTYGLRLLARNDAAAAVNNFDVQMWTEPQSSGEVERRVVSVPGRLDWNYHVREGNSYPTYADPRLLFNVIETIRVARDYANRHRHPAEQDEIPQAWVTVTPLTAFTYFDCVLSKKIWMQPSIANDDLTIIHEYAHFLQYHIGGMHCQPSSHDGCIAQLADGFPFVNNPEHAWQEGFADYLAQAIFSEQNAATPGLLYRCPNCPLGTSSLLELQARQSCSWRLIGAPFPAHVSAQPHFGPDAFEDYAAAPLWALVDATWWEPWDRISNQGDAIFKIFDHELDPKNGAPMPTIRHFFDAWVGQEPALSSYADVYDIFRHFIVGQGDDAAVELFNLPSTIVGGRNGYAFLELTNIGRNEWNSQLGYGIAPGPANTLPWLLASTPLTVYVSGGLEAKAKVRPGVHIGEYVDFVAPCVANPTTFDVQLVMHNAEGTPFGDATPPTSITILPANSCDNNGVCDNACGVAETCATCPGDCGECCGNGICQAELGEVFASCPSDCPDPCTVFDGCGECSTHPECGWCSDGSRCRSRSGTGPVVGACDAPWYSGSTGCPGPEVLASETWYHLGPNYSEELLFPGSGDLGTAEIKVTDRPLPLDPPVPSLCPAGARRLSCEAVHVSGGGHCEVVGWASEDPHDCGCVVHVGANAFEWQQNCAVTIVGQQ